jgi:hypothetical protein
LRRLERQCGSPKLPWYVDSKHCCRGLNMAHGLDEVRYVADDELLSRLERLVKADRAMSVKLLVHLGEVEARKLYLERGYSSMFSYCMTALGMSEAETYLRSLAAKKGKQFPLVLERLAEGGLHLTAIKLLAPLLTEENHVTLLDRARGMSKRQLEVLVAELAPKDDVPEKLRKLSEQHGPKLVAARRSASQQASSASQSHADGSVAGHIAAESGGSHTALGSTNAPNACETPAASAVGTNAAPNACGTRIANAVDNGDAPKIETPAVRAQASTAAASKAVPLVLQSPPARGSISPLSPGRFKLELTLGQETHDELEQLRELFRHQNPSGEITRIVERALHELLERTLKRRFAQRDTPTRQGARAREFRAEDGISDGPCGATVAPDASPSCLPEDTARDGAARAVDGVASTVGATVAPEARADGLLEHGAQDDAAYRDACSAAGEEMRGGRESGAHGGRADAGQQARAAANSRYVPRAVLREVYARDAGQCTYVSADGRRCSARGFLEVHHHNAFARGGEASVDNLRLTCRAHNFWLAERELGRVFMHGKIVQARSRGCVLERDGESGLLFRNVIRA